MSAPTALSKAVLKLPLALSGGATGAWFGAPSATVTVTLQVALLPAASRTT